MRIENMEEETNFREHVGFISNALADTMRVYKSAQDFSADREAVLSNVFRSIDSRHGSCGGENGDQEDYVL